MATTWYFRNSNAPTGPTGKASTDTDDFPFVPSDKNTPRDMTGAKGSSQVSVAGSYNNGGAAKKTFCRIFVGPALAAQTLTGAQVGYKVGVGIQESNGLMNLIHRTFVYVWRSGSGNVKTIIVPSEHIEHDTSERGCIVTATGESANFSIQDGDRIVAEIWWNLNNTRSNAYTATDYYEGATDVVDGTATSDAAGYFYCPQTLNLQPVNKSDTDSGAGADKANTFNRTILADSGLGSDISLLSKLKDSFDLGSGTDLIVTMGRTVDDSGAGLDAFNRIEHTVLDFGAGADGLKQIDRALQDSGVGAEALASIERTLLDAGVGGDSVKQIDRALQDSGLGAEVLASLSRVLTDSGLGLDLLRQIARILAESGTGAESESVDKQGGGLIEKSDTDSGAGLDKLFRIDRLLHDAGVGGEAVQQFERTLLDAAVGHDSVLGLSRILFDSGSGLDVIQRFERVLFEAGLADDELQRIERAIRESGIGNEAIVNFARTVADLGVGIDEIDEVLGPTKTVLRLAVLMKTRSLELLARRRAISAEAAGRKMDMKVSEEAS